MRYRIYDHHRGSHYDVDAECVDQAVQLVRNDQWAEQLDPANVTPVEQLNITPPDWQAHPAIAKAQYYQREAAQDAIDKVAREQGVL